MQLGPEIRLYSKQCPFLFASSTNIAELFLHVMSSTYTCNLVPLKNVVQDRVQDHPSYGGMVQKYMAC